MLSLAKPHGERRAKFSAANVIKQEESIQREVLALNYSRRNESAGEGYNHDHQTTDVVLEHRRTRRTCCTKHSYLWVFSGENGEVKFINEVMQNGQ